MPRESMVRGGVALWCEVKRLKGNSMLPGWVVRLVRDTLRFPGFALGCAVLSGFLCTGSVFGQQSAQVRLQVFMDMDVAVADAHDWSKRLDGVGFSGVEIRSAVRGERLGVRNIGTGERPVYRVTGRLTAGGTLQLPGKQFSINQSGAIRDWVTALREGGVEEVLEEKVAFGMTQRELLQLHEALGGVVERSTEGEETSELVREIADSLELPWGVASGAQTDFDRAGKAASECQGLSVGTTLAVLLKPHGLVLGVKREASGETRLEVMTADTAEEFWPVGWPVEGRPSRVVPMLEEKIKVDIKEFPIDQALGAVAKKCDLPLLFDFESLEVSGADLSEMKVSYSHANAPYWAILQRLVSQPRPSLRYELRTDDKGLPFLWVTTRR